MKMLPNKKPETTRILNLIVQRSLRGIQAGERQTNVFFKKKLAIPGLFSIFSSFFYSW